MLLGCIGCPGNCRIMGVGTSSCLLSCFQGVQFRLDSAVGQLPGACPCEVYRVVRIATTVVLSPPFLTVSGKRHSRSCSTLASVLNTWLAGQNTDPFSTHPAPRAGPRWQPQPHREPQLSAPPLRPATARGGAARWTKRLCQLISLPRLLPRTPSPASAPPHLPLFPLFQLIHLPIRLAGTGVFLLAASC